MGWFEDYHAAGGMQGLAARELYEVLGTAGPEHPLGIAGIVMQESGPPTTETWFQVVEVLRELFPAVVDAPETVEKVLSKHPPQLGLLACALMFNAEAPELTDGLRHALWWELNSLQRRRLADQVLSGNDVETESLDRLTARHIYADVEGRQLQIDAAKKPRPRKKPNLKSEFIAAMRQIRLEGMTLPVFIESVTAGSVQGLELKAGPQGSSRYELNADAIPGDAGIMVSPQTLRGWWKEAGRVS